MLRFLLVSVVAVNDQRDQKPLKLPAVPKDEPAEQILIYAKYIWKMMKEVDKEFQFSGRDEDDALEIHRFTKLFDTWKNIRELAKQHHTDEEIASGVTDVCSKLDKKFQDVFLRAYQYVVAIDKSQVPASCKPQVPASCYWWGKFAELYIPTFNLQYDPMFDGLIEDAKKLPAPVLPSKDIPPYTLPESPAIPSKKNVPESPTIPSKKNVPESPAIPSKENVPRSPATTKDSSWWRDNWLILLCVGIYTLVIIAINIMLCICCRRTRAPPSSQPAQPSGSMWTDVKNIVYTVFSVVVPFGRVWTALAGFF